MGIFKDLKNMRSEIGNIKKQGDEIGKQSGRPTSLMGMIKDAPNQLSQASAAIDDAMALQANLQAQQQLLSTGTPGTGTITAFQDTGVLVNFNPQVNITLDVEVEGQAPYTVPTQTSVPQVMLAQLQVGNRLPVRIDPTNPQNLAIDWSRFGQA